MLDLPKLLPWLGVRLSQRLGSVVVISIYITLRLVSFVNGAGYPVSVATAILLFACFASWNSVRVV